MRSFDPRGVGALECRAWETYYQRRWLAFLLASVGLVRAAFRMRWPATLYGAWLVLRANQAWAPFPDNDPDAARALMARFYGLLRRAGGSGLDPVRAAALEVEWWRAHREAQHDAAAGPEALAGALADLYAHVYDVDRVAVAAAAALRAEAMDVSDAWVGAGCDPDDPGSRRSARCSCAPPRPSWPRCTAEAHRGRVSPLRHELPQRALVVGEVPGAQHLDPGGVVAVERRDRGRAAGRWPRPRAS